MMIWILTDGKIGDRVQCAGIAAVLGRDYIEKTVSPRAPFEWIAPYGPIDPRDGPDHEDSVIAPPFPDVLIASGRRAIPYARAVKQLSGGKTFVVLLKDPRIRAHFADLIWAPLHDRRKGGNVFATLTSPHGLKAKIEASAARSGMAFAQLEQPLLGVVLGGPSGGARYDESAAQSLAARLIKAAGKFSSLAVTPSRRTPAVFIDALKDALGDHAAFFWEGEGENPYTDILGAAASLVVAADSHNMMSEAAAAAAGVYAWRPDGLAAKLGWFVDEMERCGRVRPFETDAAPFDAPPIDATGEIAAEIKRRLAVR